MRLHHLTALSLCAVLIFSCKKETETFETEVPVEYLPTQTGKFVTYRVDSTVFTNFGTVTTTRSYQEKHEIDARTTDNLGRPSYRVFRYIRDTAGTQAWKPSGSYLVTPTTNTVEVIENNLRFLKLAAPIREGKSWLGNQHLPQDAYDSYSFSNDDIMADWEYSYTGVGETLSLNGKTVNNVITVLQVDEAVNAPNTQPQAYGYINYSVEKYAKNIGLVYQELIMWEYQPNPSGGNGYKNGFGVKRSMLAHN